MTSHRILVKGTIDRTYPFTHPYSGGTGSSNDIKPLDKLMVFPKNFLQYLSHQIFGHMHGALNAIEKITNYTV